MGLSPNRASGPGLGIAPRPYSLSSPPLMERLFGPRVTPTSQRRTLPSGPDEVSGVEVRGEACALSPQRGHGSAEPVVCVKGDPSCCCSVVAQEEYGQNNTRKQ